jgi:CheY-like chemotaxis protein
MATVLVVEDEMIISMVMQDKLEAMGHSVCGMVSTGEEAIKQAGDKRPDVVLMDIMLKGDMDGIEAAGRIRERFGIPVIYLTAYGDEGTRKRARATDPIAYLVKLFEDAGLPSAIEEALRVAVKQPFE